MNARRRRQSKPGALQGEVIPPKGDAGDLPSVYADIAAQINNYTDRPDLLLEVIEKHDPGFIKGLNDESRKFSKLFRMSRFRFGRFQAYSALTVQVVVALAILFIIYRLADADKLSFPIIIGFGIFYAITQSGPSGFLKVVNQIAALFKGSAKS